MTAAAPLSATLDIEQAARAAWDVIVIGAGVAGAMAAHEAARESLRVLLVDRSQFPRWKVCGCCVNRAALQVLDTAGLGHIPGHLGASPLHALQLASGGRSARVPLQGGVAVSREQLDAALVRAAIQRGAAFLDQTQASLRPGDAPERVVLKHQHETRYASARTVIVAGGLGARCIDQEGPEAVIASESSRIGVGTVMPCSQEYSAGIIHMACHRLGYVGLVRLEDERLELAAALDVEAIRSGGGVGALVERILNEAGLPPVVDLERQMWQGTVKLTQRRAQISGEGYLVVGDAAGYVEPFTGEGMAWALATGRAGARVASRVVRGQAQDLATTWQHEYRRLVGRRMRMCRAVSFLLRRPRIVQAAVWALARRPQLAAPLQWWLNSPFDLS